jgi:chemotaxis signal transduction protein
MLKNIIGQFLLVMDLRGMYVIVICLKHWSKLRSIYLSKQLNKSDKIITWVHNSHIGDARVTEFGR